ncbi:MAG: hypothetical protein ACK518_00855 [bacterium]|jgi:hypothetical protein
MKKSVQLYIGGREISITKLLAALLFIACCTWFTMGIILIQPQELKALFLILTTGMGITFSTILWQSAIPEFYRNYNPTILVILITIMAALVIPNL